jgi:hypothetical protein
MIPFFRKAFNGSNFRISNTGNRSYAGKSSISIDMNCASATLGNTTRKLGSNKV